MQAGRALDAQGVDQVLELVRKLSAAFDQHLVDYVKERLHAFVDVHVELLSLELLFGDQSQSQGVHVAALVGFYVEFVDGRVDYVRHAEDGYLVRGVREVYDLD